MSEVHAPMKGWKTMGTKDGKTKLDTPFYVTNPQYVELYSAFIWEEVPYSEAQDWVLQHQIP